jgi:hypothetical protein
MKHQSRLVDRSGKALKKGNIVRIERIPESLLRGLPKEDQQAIESCRGKSFAIAGFNSSGEAEIEFEDASNDRHTIWIATDCLAKSD